jgi:hypothetical protein
MMLRCMFTWLLMWQLTHGCSRGCRRGCWCGFCHVGPVCVDVAHEETWVHKIMTCWAHTILTCWANTILTCGTHKLLTCGTHKILTCGTHCWWRRVNLCHGCKMKAVWIFRQISWKIEITYILKKKYEWYRSKYYCIRKSDTHKLRYVWLTHNFLGET